MAEEELKHKLRELKPELCKWVQGRMEGAFQQLIKKMPGAPLASAPSAPSLRHPSRRPLRPTSSVKLGGSAPKPTQPTPAETLAKLESEVSKRLPAVAKKLTGAAIDELTGDSSGSLAERLAKLKNELDAKVTAKLQVSTLAEATRHRGTL